MSFLMSVTRISNTMLNRNGKSGHLCLASDLGVKTFSFSPLSIMLAEKLHLFEEPALSFIDFLLSF